MKKLLIFGVAFIAVFSLASCSNDKEADPVFQVNPDNLTFGVDAKESQVIYVASSSDVGWEAEVEASAKEWLTIITEANKIIVNVAKNTTDAERTGKITIKPDNNTLKPEEVTVSQSAVKIIDITATEAFLVFFADSYECGLSNYTITMGDGDSMYDPDTGQLLIDNGYYVYFEFLTEEIKVEDYQKIDLKEGTYKSSVSMDDANFEFEKMSFIITQVQNAYPSITYCSNSVIARYEHGKIVERFIISGGEIIVKNDDGNYTVAAVLTTVDGEKCIINYVGEFATKENWVSYSTYTSDLNLSGLNTGIIEFFGDNEYSWPDLYNWYVTIDVTGYDNAANLMISFFTSKTDSTVLDAGSYNISDSSSYEPFMVEAGWAFFDLGGTWVYRLIDGEYIDYGPLVDGKVNVTHNGGDNYTIEVDAIMDNYYSCKASFKGDLEYIDTTLQPGPFYGTLSKKKVSPKTRTKARLVIDNSNLYK